MNRKIFKEDAEGKTLSKVRKLFRDKHPNGLSSAQGELDDTTFANYIRAEYRGKAFDKFGLQIAQWYLDGVLREDRLRDIQNFKKALERLVEGHLDEYDKTFNGLTPAQIVELFKEEVKVADSKLKGELKQNEYTKNEDYEIVRIADQAEAREYNKYTSWCVTNSSYNSYTGEDGIFYFILRKDYKEVQKPRILPDNPYDDYGLSMVAVSVDGNGDMKTGTSRYNHDITGFHDSNTFTIKAISELIGQNFYDVFKPRFSSEEFAKMIIERGNVDSKTKDDNQYSAYIVEYKNIKYIVDKATETLRKDAYGQAQAFKEIKPIGLGKLAFKNHTSENDRFARYGIMNSDFEVELEPLVSFITLFDKEQRVLVGVKNAMYKMSPDYKFYVARGENIGQEVPIEKIMGERN